MNILSGAIRFVAGSDTSNSAVVPRLVDRVATSALPRDRRDALAALASAASLDPATQADVGERALKVTYASLEQDREFEDTLRSVLDLLVNVCSVLDPPPLDSSLSAEAAENARSSFIRASTAAAGTNTDAFLGMPNAMVMLLDLLDTADLFIRCRTIELLTAMTANSRRTVQAAVLEAPEAVARLTDLLDDSNPLVVSNSTILLSALAESSPEICKIVSFSGVLETVFRSLSLATESLPVRKVTEPLEHDSSRAPRLEPNPVGMPVSFEASDPPSLAALEDLDSESAIQVQDSLSLVLSLLEGSPVTQSFLRDSGCVPRLASVLGCLADFVETVESTESLSAPARVVAHQYQLSLTSSLRCVQCLANATSDDSVRNISLCASLGVLQTTLRVCFPPGGGTLLVERGAQSRGDLSSGSTGSSRATLRIAAFACASALVRGGDEMRSVLSSPMPGLRGDSASRVPQLVVVETVLTDESSTIRAAAYELLCSSLIADSALDLPTSALVNALLTDGGMGQHPGSIVLAPNLPTSALSSVASTLKRAAVGWPIDADAAGVHYATSLLGWVLSRIKGARERLLSAYVMGSGDALLARSVRSLGQAVREDGPASVRIGLLRLVCTWLHDSPSAVSAFLSSAMHLPLLMELLLKTANRGDAASSVHVKGLAAITLGICLECADGDLASSDGSFVSGVGGASTGIPRGTIVDIIRNRIGVSAFMACIDELRSSRAYSAAVSGELEAASPGKLYQAENSIIGVGSCGEGVGHELWYTKDFVGLVDDVYGKVGARVVSLVAEERSDTHRTGGGRSHGPPRDDRDLRNSPFHTADSSLPERNVSRTSQATSMTGTVASSVSPLVESSSRDEVLTSYKDLIRTQDVSLAEARAQVGELEAALREAQLELDAKNRLETSGASRGERGSLLEENMQLQEKSSTLESMLREKSDELTALSNAYSALEAMVGSADIEDMVAERDAIHKEQIGRLQEEKSAVLSQFYEESDKVSKLEFAKKSTEVSEERLKAVLRSVEQERDLLRNGAGGSELASAAEWKRRAEVGEQQAEVLSHALKQFEVDQNDLRSRLREVKASLEDSRGQVHVANSSLAKLQSDISQLEASRAREVQMAREATILAERTASAEIASLRDELHELRSTRAAGASNAVTDEPYLEAVRERDLAVNRAEAVSSELVDVRNSVSEWKRRAGSFETQASALRMRNEELAQTLEVERTESRRLLSARDDSQSALDQLKSDLESKENEVSIASRRVSELEEQCADLEEMRDRDAEELSHLREEVASRAEQTIRLSGKVYEAEEARVAAEAKLEASEARMKAVEVNNIPMSDTGVSSRSGEEDEPVHRRSEEDAEYIGALNNEIIEGKVKITALQELLDDANDKLGLSSALSRDRDEALSKLHALEAELVSVKSEKEALQSRILEMEDKMMSLGEAEDAKRVLSERVGELQRALTSAESRMAQEPIRTDLSKASPSTGSVRQDKSEEVVDLLRRDLQETAAKLAESESKLARGLAQEASDQKKMVEYEKRLTESETLLSVISGEKLEQSARISELENFEHALKNQLNSLGEQARTLEAENKEQRVLLASKAVESAESTSNSAQQTVDILQSQLEEREKCISEMEMSIQALKDELDVKDTAVHQMESSVSDIRSAMLAKESETTGLRESQERISRKLSEAEKEKEESLAELRLLQDAAKERESEAEQLRHALSDAARTFKLSAQELAQREELLVEISRDKTEVTDELARAREEIDGLRSDGAAAAAGFEGEKRQLLQYVHEIELKTEHLESSLASLRAGSGATSIDSMPTQSTLSTTCELLESVDLQLRDLEDKHSSIVSERASDRSRISSLENQLQRTTSELKILKEVADAAEHDAKISSSKRESELAFELEAARAELAQVTASSNCALDEKLRTISLEAEERVALSHAELDRVRSEASVETSKWKTLVEAGKEQIETYVSDLMTAKDGLAHSQKELGETRACLQVALAERETFDERSAEKSGRIAELESSVSQLTDSISKLEQDLADADRQAQDEGAAMRRRHESEVLELQNSRDVLVSSLAEVTQSLAGEQEARALTRENTSKRIADLESEIATCTDACEAAERQLRDLRKSSKLVGESLKVNIARLEHEKEELSIQVSTKARELSDLKEQNEVEVASLAGSLASSKAKCEEFEVALRSAREEHDALHSQLSFLQTELSGTAEKLRESEAKRESMAKSLIDVSADRDLLRESCEELTSKLEHSEFAVENIQSALDTEKHTSNSLRKSLAVQVEKSDTHAGEVRRMDDEVERLRRTRGRLEEETDSLQSQLDATEAMRSSLEKDNADLRAWVNDLEKQANGLQSLADKFEDVERSLDEAVAAHQSAVESNELLSEEVSVLGRQLKEARSESRLCRADKEAAEAAQELSRSQVKELEARLHDIRSTHANRLSATEDNIKSTVRRCAELESALVTAERQIAESATLSDKVFNFETQLRQAKVEASANLSRADAAEIEVEQARQELADVRKELTMSRASAGHEAYAELEAEHNELLMCLAELELECTQLKDAAAAGGPTSRGYESVSAR